MKINLTYEFENETNDCILIIYSCHKHQAKEGLRLVLSCVNLFVVTSVLIYINLLLTLENLWVLAGLEYMDA